MTDCKPFLLIWFCQALVLATWKATKRHTELSLGIETYLPEPKGKLQHLPSVLTSGDVNHRRAQGGSKGWEWPSGRPGSSVFINSGCWNKTSWWWRWGGGPWLREKDIIFLQSWELEVQIKMLAELASFKASLCGLFTVSYTVLAGPRLSAEDLDPGGHTHRIFFFF